MKFYHCTNRIKVPDPLKIRQAGTDYPVLPAMYANSVPQHDYGKNVYAFNMAEDTTYFLMSSKMYMGMRFDKNYRAGFFDALKRAGYEAAYRLQPEGDTTLVILNFDKIENWELTDLSQEV